MTVLLDVEWIEKEEKHLSQISAIRVDEEWTEISRIDLFVNPGAECLQDGNHIAFGGYDISRFENGLTEMQSIMRLNHWLKSDDYILVWAKSNNTFLRSLWKRNLGMRIANLYDSAIKIRELVNYTDQDNMSSYAVLSHLGGEVVYPEHRASNDVEVFRRILAILRPSIELFMNKVEEPQKAAPPLQPSERRKLNLEMVEKTEFNYIYLKGSSVFHRRSCKAWQNAKRTSVILGSVYYNTAAKDHEPCKLCKPVPSLLDAAQEEKWLASLYVDPDEVISTEMITGEVIQIKRRNVVGWCHNSIHKGALNKSLLQEHDCLGKNCHFLARNCQSSFWKDLELKQKAKEKRKSNARWEKAKKYIEEDELRSLNDEWQSWLDDMESDMFIVRLEKTPPGSSRCSMFRTIVLQTAIVSRVSLIK